MVDVPGEDDPDASGNPFTAKSPNEPEEFDPDSIGPDPPEPPETPSPDEIDTDSEAAGLFVKLVVVFNVAVLALALGPMLAYFEGMVDLGLRVFLLGLLVGGYGTYRYYQFRTDRNG